VAKHYAPLVANRGAVSANIETAAVRRLFRAVLEGALDDLRAGFGRHPKSLRGRRAAAARRWLFDQDTRAPISFADVCAAFGWDPEWTRMRLRKKLEKLEAEQLRDSNDDALRPVEKGAPMRQSDADFLLANGFRIAPGLKIIPD
jgi:hypothetical protein